MLGFWGHETRDTRHESRPLCFSPATRRATRFFPVPPATPGRATPSPANGFFTNHETRDTNHGLYAFLPATRRATWFWPVPPATPGRATPSAAWVFPNHVPRDTAITAFMGFHQPRTLNMQVPPASRESNSKPGQRVLGSRITKHETRITAFMLFTSRETRNMVFPCSSSDSKESNPKPGQLVFHESRITKHESRPLCLSSRHFPLFFGTPLPPESVSARRQPQLPPPSGLASAAANAK